MVEAEDVKKAAWSDRVVIQIIPLVVNDATSFMALCPHKNNDMKSGFLFLLQLGLHFHNQPLNWADGVFLCI